MTSQLREYRARSAAARRGAAIPNAARTGDGFRADIQGLRGVAVLIVALGHAGVPGMSGGYVGVDVFFVISGFLITGWLLARALDSGRVPFGDFYASRARRILPAAVLTLVVTCAASVAYLNPVRAASALHDAVWAAFFSANIHFAEAGTDYFAQDDPPSPFQHFWTLAVEEQFYLAWPLLLAAALLILRVRRRGRGVSRGALAGVVALGVGASLAWSIHATGTNPTSAYFSTPARAWELGVGALIAIGTPWVVRVPAGLRAALTWVGVAGILVATVAYGPGTPFPGFAALLPVAAAGLIVAGGAGPVCRAGAGVILGRQPLRLVGDLSYAFYLWHWPPLVIAAQYAGHPLSTLENLILLALAFAVSYVTFRMFENPLRHARRLRPPRLALALWPISLSAVVLAAALGTVSVATPSAAAPSLDAYSVVAQAGQRSQAKPTTVREALLESVSSARLRQPVPRALAPPLGQLLDDRYRLGACMAGPGATSSKVCEFGDLKARRRLVVLGDSHAAMWMPALIPFALRYHWRLVPLIKPGVYRRRWAPAAAQRGTAGRFSRCGVSIRAPSCCPRRGRAGDGKVSTPSRGSCRISPRSRRGSRSSRIRRRPVAPRSTVCSLAARRSAPARSASRRATQRRTRGCEARHGRRVRPTSRRCGGSACGVSAQPSSGRS